MIEIIAPPPAQYLRPDAIRGGIDLLMFAHRAHLACADEALAERGMGRAHHRILYFLSRKPGGTVSALLAVLGVTKQSLNRVMKDLQNEELIELRTGEEDRRTRLVYLTDKGAQLEHSLFEDMHANMARGYAAAGEAAVRGYWTLMQHLMDEANHQRFLAFNTGGANAY